MFLPFGHRQRKMPIPIPELRGKGVGLETGVGLEAKLLGLQYH